MHPISVIVGTTATVALAVGTLGMAQANPQTGPNPSHGGMANMKHGLVGVDPGSEPALTKAEVDAASANKGRPKLRGKVNNDRDLTIGMNPVPSGRYKLVIRDTTKRHNWHIFGNGLDKKTTVRGTGTWRWKVRLKDGSYTVVCDPHARNMRFTLHVT
jgi:hypothetical protein